MQDVRRSNFHMHLASLVGYEVISMKDLEGFSDETKENNDFVWKSDSFYNDHASITDKNQKELFKCLGCDIEKADPGLRLFFTNYSLGYRK